MGNEKNENNLHRTAMSGTQARFGLVLRLTYEYFAPKYVGLGLNEISVLVAGPFQIGRIIDIIHYSRDVTAFSVGAGWWTEQEAGNSSRC